MDCHSRSVSANQGKDCKVPTVEERIAELEAQVLMISNILVKVTEFVTNQGEINKTITHILGRRDTSDIR